MDFATNNTGLDNLLSQFQAFVGKDNPNCKFGAMLTPIEQYQKSPVLAKEALGDGAGDDVHGVVCGEGDNRFVALFTGNTTGGAERAQFLADLLSNFHIFYAWMKSYLDMRENGYSIMYAPDRNEDGSPKETGSWLAIGPGFQSLEESAHAKHETAEAAFAALLAQIANEPFLDPAWDNDMKAFGRQVEWMQPERCTPGDDGVTMQEIKITGRWTKPGTRLAVKTHRTVPIEYTEADMKTAKAEVIEELWANKDRAGGIYAP